MGRARDRGSETVQAVSQLFKVPGDKRAGPGGSTSPVKEVWLPDEVPCQVPGSFKALVFRLFKDLRGGCGGEQFRPVRGAGETGREGTPRRGEEGEKDPGCLRGTARGVGRQVKI